MSRFPPRHCQHDTQIPWSQVLGMSTRTRWNFAPVNSIPPLQNQAVTVHTITPNLPENHYNKREIERQSTHARPHGKNKPNTWRRSEGHALFYMRRVKHTLKYSRQQYSIMYALQKKCGIASSETQRPHIEAGCYLPKIPTYQYLTSRYTGSRHGATGPHVRLTLWVTH